MNPHSVDILLVDDNPHDAELAVREFKKNMPDNQLVHVRDGEEALDFIFGTGKFAATTSISSPPRLVLLDIKMPRINGIEVLEKIKTDPRTRSIPVVMLTSSKLDPDIQKCYQLGANSYIVKPVDFDGFAAAIKNLGFFWLLLNKNAPQ
jgi:two-component system, response regulator